jgi:multidrug efflux pump
MMMDMFGFSINLMTLLAMVLAIGLVVDDAIVVLENVDRHIKEGEELFRAAIIGTREIAVPVIAMTVTLAAVYAPIALMGASPAPCSRSSPSPWPAPCSCRASSR